MKTCFKTYDRMGTLTYLKAIRKLGDFLCLQPGMPMFLLLSLSYGDARF